MSGGYMETMMQIQNEGAMEAEKQKYEEEQVEWLFENGYDGLYYTANLCSCKTDDLHPCGYQPDECVPGVLIDCKRCNTVCESGSEFCIGNKPDRIETGNLWFMQIRRPDSL